MMHEPERSDFSVVAGKPTNKPGQPRAEPVEPREGTEGNAGKPDMRRTPSRESLPQGLDRVRQAAREGKKERFTALLHHVTIDLLRDAYSWLERDAAPGVDGLTWKAYGEDLQVRLAALHEQVHRGGYRAQPSRRKFIAKPDGVATYKWAFSISCAHATLAR